MMKTSVRIAALAAMFAGVAHPAAGQTPLGTEFTYQGALKDAGSPANGLHDLRFRLFDALVGGGQVGAQLCANNVTVTDGLFTLALDFGAQFAGQERFLEIDVRADTDLDCANPAGFVTLAPRQALTAAPNSVFSLNADKLDGLDSTAFLQSIPMPLTLSGNSNAHIIRGQNASTANGAAGVFGLASAASGGTNGGRFESDSTSGRGVYGLAPAITGINYGGYFESASKDGRGLYGLATATGGATYGMYGETASNDGRGVYGFANADNGFTYGVYGRSDSPDGRGLAGWATAASGITIGVRGGTDSTDGRGVYGQATAATGITFGVFGTSDSASGRGVYGQATASGAGDTPYGVRGFCRTGTLGYAVYANGDMGASGNKPFRIDHPFDPENKYLLHYAAESPEVINFYSGKVMLDTHGEAVVELPPYFASVNKDPRYTLTAVGAPMPMLHVAEEIDEAALSAGSEAGPGEVAPVCSFRVAGGAPGGKVSWRVEAVRNDRWVQQRGAPVEIEKQGLERGTYQHPELYGQPKEMGMDYRPEVERPERERPSPPALPDATLNE